MLSYMTVGIVAALAASATKKKQRNDMQFIYDVATRVRDLHRASWAHRDLKPSNIMYMSTSKKWVLIDFGVSAPIGEEASVRGTAIYAAPELAEAFLGGQQTMESTAAVDAWSLGIIALELLLGQHPLRTFAPRDEVRCPHHVFECVSGGEKCDHGLEQNHPGLFF